MTLVETLHPIRCSSARLVALGFELCCLVTHDDSKLHTVHAHHTLKKEGVLKEIR